MDQIIEGVDNEVTLILFFTTTIIALVVPFYVARLFYPRIEHSYETSTVDEETEDEIPQQHSTEADTNETNHQPESENIKIRPQTTKETDSISSSSTTNPGLNQDNISPTNTIGSETHTHSTAEQFLLKVKVQEVTHENYVTEQNTLLELKQKFFPTEFAEGKLIRFVYAGRVLTDDQKTLKDFGITAHCVVQCVISESPSSSTESGTNSSHPADEDGLDLSIALYVFYGLLMVSSWGLLFWSDDWFSNLGILFLSILSVLGYFIFL